MVEQCLGANALHAVVTNLTVHALQAEPPWIDAVAQVMRELGWTPVRVRDLTRGGYKEQVRGYCRDVRCRADHL